MQHLQFETAWDKTLSAKDRHFIQEIFLETRISASKENILFTPLWQAVNHQGALLVTVLIHNFSTRALSFNDQTLLYLENGETVAEYSFTLPQLNITGKTSMPWTFIFPATRLNQQPLFENGELVIPE
ncbi:SLAP domain-containing protein [Pullulanibacillus pueri]|uniref:SLAP domain-containing protein n=1 Tax=Pullulanibacillus pueri TaxID=1437324 RepID=A0A8J3EM00_9BACL|nr:SLAP domain-containing protein [Pullulanibacillus pueri]MBM7680833.1 SLAP domain-containing protein [Pullulanibacillus pueri]GGH78510.1 hypothetical protein GCM10007096_12050 [Pullulanibacillus pueri]